MADQNNLLDLLLTVIQPHEGAFDHETKLDLVVKQDEEDIGQTIMIETTYAPEKSLHIPGVIKHEGEDTKFFIHRTPLLNASKFFRDYGDQHLEWRNHVVTRNPTSTIAKIYNYQDERGAIHVASFDELGEDAKVVVPLMALLHENFNVITNIFTKDDLIAVDNPPHHHLITVISYYYSIITCIHPTIRDSLLASERAGKFFKSVVYETQPKEVPELNKRFLTTEALLFMGYVSKPWVQVFTQTWLDRRTSALHKGNKAVALPRSRTRTAKCIADYWLAHPEVRQEYFTLYLNPNLPSAEPMAVLALDLKKQVKMVLEWSELHFYRAAYLYISGHNPALLTNPEFSRQAVKLVELYRANQAELGDNHPYGRLLGRIDDQADVSNYPDVALSALYSLQTHSDSWKNFVEPASPNLALSKSVLKQNCNRFIGLQAIETMSKEVTANLTKIGKSPNLFKAGIEAIAKESTNPFVQQMRMMKEMFTEMAKQGPPDV